MEYPHKKKRESMETMETAAACEIARLPEDLLSAVISRTAPRDACRAAAVSPAFRAAADSDAVWSTFLPRDLPPLADGEISPAPPSKKGLFLRLSDRPLLLTDRLMSWMDRETGTMCYVLLPRALQIVWEWGDTQQCLPWIPLNDSRFPEGAQLMVVCWLEIRGKIHSNMLSQNSTYAAYMVFKMADEFYGLDSPLQEASVSVGGSISTRQVCLQGSNQPANQPGVVLPQRRADGWLELEMGEFCSEEGEDGEVCISLTESNGGNWKKGLIVQGIEIRPKSVRLRSF